jgi:hypothetical protein
MSHIERHAVTLTTDSSGDATGYTPVITGRISAIHYVKTDFANGVDFTVTAEATGETIWAETNVNASATRAPRQATHGTDGAAALYAAGGTAVQAPIGLAHDRVKIVVAQGGDTKTGAFHVVFE